MTSTPFRLAEQMNPAEYEPLRRELRQFYPDECHEDCKNPEIVQNYRAISAKMDKFLALHPDASVFAAKQEFYRVTGADFKPVLFRNLPFYFEAGVNGGWVWCSTVGRGWFSQRFNERRANQIPADRIKRQQKRIDERFITCCGFFYDEIHHIPPLTTILTHGFSGVYEKAKMLATKAETPSEKRWFEAIFAGLEAIHAIQLKFAAEAERILREEKLTPQQAADMRRIADSAVVAPWQPPRTFYEGLNTLWFVREILGVVDGLAVFSLGHPDAMLAKLYDDDLAAGRLTPEEAFRLISCYLLVAECHHNPMSIVHDYGDHELEIPVTLGGCDQDGREIFNDITKMCMLAHLKLELSFPKLHCRCSAKSSEEYLRLIADGIYRGHCVYTVFNDDIFIPTLMRSGKTAEDAKSYICCGCWDAGSESRENRYGANYFSLARILEATVYPDKELYREAGLDFKTIDHAADYEEVKRIILDNVLSFARSVLDDHTASESSVVLATPHPVYSACLEWCMENRRDESAGGAKYSPCDLVMSFLGNLVDSLLAINEVVFQKHRCTLPEFLACVRSNWTIRPELRAAVLKAPHWGDDTPASGALASEIQCALADIVENRRNGRGGRYVLDAWTYREYHYWGAKTRALPDGRRDGDDLAQALTPSFFRNDRELTTVFNALSRLDHRRFDASNVNVTLEKSNVTVEHLAAVFRAFCALKMHALQPNCFSKKELEDAQLHPEQHMNLIVKVCGFSAKFVALSPEWQKVVLDRCVF